MLSFDDERWDHLTGGYKSPFDPRPCLQKLESRQDIASAWKELWEDLHHQGDVGDASYAAVPELVRIHRDESAADWNLYAMVAIIELARTESRNPDVPNWLREDYFHAIEELARMGAKEIFTGLRNGNQKGHPQRDCNRTRSSDAREGPCCLFWGGVDRNRAVVVKSPVGLR